MLAMTMAAVIIMFLQGLPKVVFFDVSWNYLTSYYDDLGPLRKHCPALESLDTRYNPWNKVKQMFTMQP